MLKGSIFPDLVKELCVNASIPFERNEIRSFVFGHSVRITGTTIADAIEYPDVGASVNNYLFNYDFVQISFIGL